ncbi:MAG: acyl-CoA thioesterase II [Micrococcus sp.]|nr:acyl-CoA thioesterase II [Micrococcus sp.]
MAPTPDPSRRRPLTPPADAPADPTDKLRALLALEDAPAHPVTGETRFTGHTPPQGHGHVFGGQVLGQCLTAASRTVAEDRPAHSLHGYFIRRGDATAPITFTVENLRDGRSFSVRRVLATQHDQAIMALTCSFQEPAEGLDHHLAMPTGLPDPEELPTTAEQIGGIKHPVAEEWSWSRAFDIRHIEPALYFRKPKQQTATSAVWLKTFSPLGDDPQQHRAALAYASDYTLLEPILRQHGLAWSQPGLTGASLDHAMWFHREARVDDWLLYTQTSPSAQGARGLGLGHIYTRDGLLVATVAQEGMMRVPVGAAARTRSTVANTVQQLALRTVLRRGRGRGRRR